MRSRHNISALAWSGRPDLTQIIHQGHWFTGPGIWYIESRGPGRRPVYGGSRSGTSMRVDADSDATVVGDEPVLLAKRAQCPVAVDADRIRAATMLVEDGVDVIISDDGLQHRRLERDFEICIVDGTRGLGNRRLLPSGPLRESQRRP